MGKRRSHGWIKDGRKIMEKRRCKRNFKIGAREKTLEKNVHYFKYLNSFIFFICAQKKRIFHIFRRYFESVESLQIFLTLQQGKDNEREKTLFCPKIWFARTYKNERYKKRIKFTFAEGWWKHIWGKIQTLRREK